MTPAAVRARTDAIQAERKASQPYGIRSLGSVFKNPPGDKAGRLVEAAGLKGRRARWRADLAEARQLHRQRRSRDRRGRARARRVRARRRAAAVRRRPRARDHRPRRRRAADAAIVAERLRVGVFFGSRSVEHEVSVITAQQAMAAMPADRMIPVPVYIAKSGAWYTGEQLLQLERYKDIDRLIAASTRVTMRPEPGRRRRAHRGRRRGAACSAVAPRTAARFDVAMPLVHGSNGEDGTLQGLFELAASPYCGCDVVSAAVSMDKRLARTTLRGAGIPVLDDVAVSRARWLETAEAVCAELERSRDIPMYVKPRRLGSSIGVARVEIDEQLRDSARARVPVRHVDPRRARAGRQHRDQLLGARTWATMSRCRCASSR